MKKIISVLFLSFFINVFSQVDPEGDRAGTIFYSTVDRGEEVYDIVVDLYELGSVGFIEAELYNEENQRLISKVFEIVSRNKKYYLKSDDTTSEEEVFLYDIKIQLKNPDNSLKYPKVKVKMLREDHQMIDFSQKVFY